MNAATADQGDGSVSGEGPMTAPSPSSAAWIASQGAIIDGPPIDGEGDLL